MAKRADFVPQKLRVWMEAGKCCVPRLAERHGDRRMRQQQRDRSGATVMMLALHLASYAATAARLSYEII